MTIPLLLLLFVFLPPIVSLSAITTNVSSCQGTQRCGNVNVSYPFFIRPRNISDSLICGFPDYDMTCNDDVLYKELLSSVYRIIKIDMKNKTFVVAENAAFVESGCPKLDRNFTGLSLTADVTNLTFFFDCREDSPSLDDHRISCYSKNTTSTYVFDQMKDGQLLPKDCDRVIEAPVLRSNVENANLTQNFKAILKLGFEVYWNPSVSADCNDCYKSGGLCAAYGNPEKKVEATCVCEDGRRSKPNHCRACQLTEYICGGDNSNSTHTRSCGSHRFKCSGSNNLEIQFGGKGPWYVTGNITYPPKKIRVLDYHLTKKLPKNCDFLYNFTSPISDFYPSSIAQLNASASIFNCSGNSYNFSNDVFEKYHRSGYCSRYDLYYSHHRPSVLATSVDNWVEWEMSYGEDAKSGDIVDFSLLSVGFSNRRILSPESFNCQMKSGLCSPVSDSSFNCSCDHGCGGKSTKLTTALISASASVACLAFLVLGYWLFQRKRRGKTKTKTKSSSRQATSLFRSMSEFSAKSTVDNGDSTYSETHIFSYKELEKATDGFSADMEIGDGGFGAVYKGVLGDGRIVAVKRPYENNFKRLEQFMNEIAILKQVRHPNLVSLYGCTTHDSQQLLLVYEFVPNGTVADHLALNINPPPLAAERGGGGMNWALRMNIAVEIAEALSYLHSFVPQIIHRDVKTNNILLDNDYHVKVADFGLSRLFPLDVTHVSTAPQGTPGYVDPEYYQCYQLTDKSDVFSFGVVLVELISSKPAVDITRSRHEINLSNMAMNRISNGLVHELADPMLGYETDPEVRRTVEQVAEVAFLCLQSDKDMRPPMKDVKEKLVDIVSKSKCATLVSDSTLTPTMPSPSQSPMSYSNTTISTLDFHSNGSNSISKQVDVSGFLV